MTKDGDQLLQHIFDALPLDQRVAFVARVVESLPENEKDLLIQQIGELEPGRLEAVGTASQSTGDREVDSCELLGHPKTVARIEAKVEGTPEEILAQEMEKFSAIASAASAQDNNRLKREMVGCIAIIGVILVILSVMAFVGREAWEFLLSLF